MGKIYPELMAMPNDTRKWFVMDSQAKPTDRIYSPKGYDTLSQANKRAMSMNNRYGATRYFPILKDDMGVFTCS